MNSEWSTTWDLAGRSQLLRLRETHVRDNVAPLLKSGSHGAVKLDLILRGLARNKPNGRLPPAVSWADLHDLARPREFYGNDARLKRNWVGPKLEQLEGLNLIVRTARPGCRSSLRILADDRSGRPIDDPDGSGWSTYVTIPTDLVGYGWLREWRSSQIAALFACMAAERYSYGDGFDNLKNDLRIGEVGNGLWLRPLHWFSDSGGHRPTRHVRFPFSQRSLQRGMTELVQEGLLVREFVYRSPTTGAPFRNNRPRYLYWNQFHDARRSQPPHRRRNRIPAQVLRRFMTSRRASDDSIVTPPPSSFSQTPVPSAAR